jgi:hypothetical protein
MLCRLFERSLLVFFDIIARTFRKPVNEECTISFLVENDRPISSGLSSSRSRDTLLDYVSTKIRIDRSSLCEIHSRPEGSLNQAFLFREPFEPGVHKHFQTTLLICHTMCYISTRGLGAKIKFWHVRPVLKYADDKLGREMKRSGGLHPRSQVAVAIQLPKWRASKGRDRAVPDAFRQPSPQSSRGIFARRKSASTSSANNRAALAIGYQALDDNH